MAETLEDFRRVTSLRLPGSEAEYGTLPRRGFVSEFWKGRRRWRSLWATIDENQVRRGNGQLPMDSGISF